MGEKKWIVECPHGVYSIDKDLEKYLNTNPHPDYILHQAILRHTTSAIDQIYILIWRRTKEINGRKQ